VEKREITKEGMISTPANTPITLKKKRYFIQYKPENTMSEVKSGSDEKINAYAAFSPAGYIRPWSYTPRPIGDRDIEVKITHCGICHSDLHTMDQGQGWGKTNYPVVVGHEIVGHVVKKGKKVDHLDIGDRVGVGAQVGSCMKDTCYDCKSGDNNHCTKGVFTYNGKYEDGKGSYGGYAERIRVSSDFALKIPDNIPSDLAAPLFCAGVTVYSPLREHGVTKNTKVAITGMGGLGHLAVQFANKMGAHVTVISHSKSKQKDAATLGAHAFLDSADKKAMAVTRQFDLILVTAAYPGIDWNNLLSLCRVRGKVVLVGAPEEEVHFDPFNVILGSKNFCGSIIGSTGTIQEMLDFCSRNDVRPVVQNLPMHQVNEGVEAVRNGTVRYRIVLENGDGSRDRDTFLEKQKKRKQQNLLCVFGVALLGGLKAYRLYSRNKK